ncbi:MAG: M2 family metallopeptidase [Pseudomonadota bacterium]
MRKITREIWTLFLFFAFCPPALAAGGAQKRADEFLKTYNAFHQPITYQVSEAYWKASTDVKDESVGERIGAEKTASVFWGNRYVIDRARELLKHRRELAPITVRQLRQILYLASRYPATIPDVVRDLVEAEAKQAEIQDAFQYCLKRSGTKCTKPITPNGIDEILLRETNLKKRLQAWSASKELGKPLKDGLERLEALRNRVAKEMGHSSFFALQVSDYDMSVADMMSLLDRTLADTKPLYDQLHCWAKNDLAKKYGRPVPKKIPADWLGNRWGQEWPGLVKAAELDDLFKGKTPQWIVEQAERFYLTLGFSKLPESFWKKSDLFALPANAPRKKNTHASAWHMDIDHDVRSLMSVEPNWYWFGTAHHELGHIFYFLSYSRPAVPLVLREGANRAFHEAVGDLIFIASTQPEYLRKIGLLPADRKIDATQWMLNQALEESIVFLPWSAGVMSHFEHDLYEKNLPKSDFNRRWWELVNTYQGIEAPGPRPEDSCDACTKTHINDDPAQYYDYALAVLIKHQLHSHICSKILKTDVHSCDYTRDPKVGAFLSGILKAGKTRDWRKVMMEATGEPIGSRALMEYYAPLAEYLKSQNAGRECSY